MEKSESAISFDSFPFSSDRRGGAAFDPSRFAARNGFSSVVSQSHLSISSSRPQGPDGLDGSLLTPTSAHRTRHRSLRPSNGLTYIRPYRITPSLFGSIVCGFHELSSNARCIAARNLGVALMTIYPMYYHDSSLRRPLGRIDDAENPNLTRVTFNSAWKLPPRVYISIHRLDDTAGAAPCLRPCHFHQLTEPTDVQTNHTML